MVSGENDPNLLKGLYIIVISAFDPFKLGKCYYWRYMKDMLHRESELKRAKEAHIADALEMKLDGVPIDKIMQYTKLPRAVIEAL